MSSLSCHAVSAMYSFNEEFTCYTLCAPSDLTPVQHTGVKSEHAPVQVLMTFYAGLGQTTLPAAGFSSSGTALSWRAWVVSIQKATYYFFGYVHTLKKKNKKQLTWSSGKMGLPVSLLVIYLSIWYSVWGIIDSIEIWQMNSWITIKNICEYYWPWQTRRYLDLFFCFSFLFQRKHYS